MTKKELQGKHDSEVKAAIAAELGHLTDQDLEADDSSERILVRLMAGAVAAQSVHDRLRHEKADDASDNDYWFLGFRLEEAIATVLWWFTTARDYLDLEELEVPCIGSGGMSAYGTFVAMRRLKMSYESEIDAITDDFGKEACAAIRRDVEKMPTGM